MELSAIELPSASVVSVWQAKAHCRVTHDDEDELFETYARAADARCEDVTGRQLLSATWEAWLDTWPASGCFVLPRPNLQSVTSVKYLDTSGVEQTLDPATYVVEAPSGPRAGFGRISLAYAQAWPTTLAQAKAIRVRYVAGYGESGDVPWSIVQGLLLTIGTWWSFREDATDKALTKVPLAASRLWRPFYAR